MVQPHCDLILHGRFAPAHFVCLPQGRDLRQDCTLALLCLGNGQGQPVKLLQLSGDATTFKQHHPPCNLCWVGGENRYHFDAPQPLQGLLVRYPGSVHTLQGRPERAWFARSQCYPMGAAAAFAVICLGKVGQLKEGGKGLGDQVCILLVQPGDDLYHLLKQVLFCGVVPGGAPLLALLLAVLDGQLPQPFLQVIYPMSGLCHDHLSQEPAQRTDIPAQGKLFEFFVIGGQFVQAA